MLTSAYSSVIIRGMFVFGDSAACSLARESASVASCRADGGPSRRPAVGRVMLSWAFVWKVTATRAFALALTRVCIRVIIGAGVFCESFRSCVDGGADVFLRYNLDLCDPRVMRAT